MNAWKVQLEGMLTELKENRVTLKSEMNLKIKGGQYLKDAKENWLR
jgi:hypothetical protein